MSQSSGVFSFPATGFYWVNFHAYYYSNNQGATTYIGTKILTTVDNSTYVTSAQGYQNGHANQAHVQPNVATIFDVTSTTNCKFRIDAQSVASSNTVGASTGETITGFTVFRIGDT